MGQEVTAGGGSGLKITTISGGAPFPWTIGFWIYPYTTGAEKYFAKVGTMGGAAAGIEFGQSSTTNWLLGGDDGGTLDRVTGGTIATQAWAYVVGRGISATDRWMDVLNSDGSITSLHGTVSKTYSGSGLSFLWGSAAAVYDGRGAELFFTRTNINPNGSAAMDKEMMFQLAYGGPFSIPHVEDALVLYRSFRKHWQSDDLTDNFLGKDGQQTWALNTNAPSRHTHPPLPYWYKSPLDLTRNIPI